MALALSPPTTEAAPGCSGADGCSFDKKSPPRVRGPLLLNVPPSITIRPWCCQFARALFEPTMSPYRDDERTFVREANPDGRKYESTPSLTPEKWHEMALLEAPRATRNGPESYLISRWRSRMPTRGTDSASSMPAMIRVPVIGIC